jgi:hypothetical protein
MINIIMIKHLQNNKDKKANQNILIDSTDPLKLNFIDCGVRYILS